MKTVDDFGNLHSIVRLNKETLFNIRLKRFKTLTPKKNFELRTILAFDYVNIEFKHVSVYRLIKNQNGTSKHCKKLIHRYPNEI